MLNNLFNIDKVTDQLQKLPQYFGLNVPGEGAQNSKALLDNHIEEMTEGAVSLADWLNYQYYDEEQQLFFNRSNFVGFLIEMTPIVGVNDSLLKNLYHFFNNELLEDSWLQFLMVASSDVEPVIKKWQAGRTQKHPILDKLTVNRANFIRELAVSFGRDERSSDNKNERGQRYRSREQADGRIARDFKVYLSFSQKYSKGSTNFNKVIDYREKILRKFNTLNLNAKVCEAEDLIRLVKELVQMPTDGNGTLPIQTTSLNKTNSTLNKANSAKIKYDPLNPLSEQAVEPLQMLKVTAESIVHEYNGLVTKHYYLKDLPQDFSLNQMIGLLGSSDNSAFAIPARFVISYTVVSDISKATSAKLTTNGQRVIDAAEQWYSRNDRDLKREAAEWQEINDRVKNGQQFLTESFSVMITAPEGEAIHTAEQALISLYNNLDFKLSINHNLQMLSQLAMLPMQQGIYWQALKNFKLTRVCLSDEVIARLPIHGEWTGVPSSGVLLHARRGQLFNWNPFYRISSGNYNVSLFGPSGGGKSVFLQELVITQLSQGTRVFVLDIGQSFANITNLLDGEIIQFGKKASLSLNPFAAFNYDMQEDDRAELLKCAKALLSTMCGIKEDDHHGSAELEKALVQALVEYNFDLDISKFAIFLEQQNSSSLKRFGATLYPYTQDGLNGKYFNGTKAASFKSQLVTFEFEEIKNDPKLLSIILQILLMQVTNQFLTGDRLTPFMIIVDEAWMLLDFAAAFFAAFGRTVRKYGGSLVICVQNFTDLQKTQDHRAILENSTWTLMLKQDEKGIEAFKNSEAFKDMVPLIQSISLSPGKYSEVFIHATGVQVIGRLMLDNYAKVLYSTDASDFSYLSSAVANGISLEQAVEDRAIMKYGTAN